MPTIFPNNAPLSVRCDGLVVTNVGPGTVYFADSSEVSTTSFEGSLAANVSTVLDGVQWFVSSTRADILLGGASIAAPVVAGTVTKRAGMFFGAEAGALTAAPTDTVQRVLVNLPVQTIRWRLKAANYNAQSLTVGTAVYNFGGAWLGTPAFSAGSRWTGNFVSAATSVGLATGGVIPNGGTDFTSDWVTDSALQFSPGQTRGLSVGTTFVSGGNAFLTGPASSKGIFYTAAGIASNGGAAGVPGGSLTAGGFFDFRMEYEFTTTTGDAGEVLTGLFIGDSITAGNFDVTLYGMPHEAWPGAASLRTRKFVPLNAGIQSGRSLGFATAGNRRWQRFDVTTYVPDFACISVGSNDIALDARSANSVKVDLENIYNNIKALGIKRIGWATIIPRNLSATPEAERVALNNWMRDLSLGAQFCWDQDKAVRLQATPAVPDADLVPSNIHPNPGGAQVMASVVEI